MAGDFLHRLRKRARLNLEALHEGVIAVSERVSRKVQIISLHWQAAGVQAEIDALQGSAGSQLVDLADDHERLPLASFSDFSEIGQKAHGILSDITVRLAWLRRELQRIDMLIRELEAETLREDLLKLQQDLSVRGAGVTRLNIPPQSIAIGRTADELGMPPAVRVAAVFRGPVVLSDTVPLRRGDTIVVTGPIAEVREFTDQLMRRAPAMTSTPS